MGRAIGSSLFLALLLWAWLLSALLLSQCHAEALVPARAAIVTPEDLDRIEARLLASRAILERWEELADRRQQAEPIVCDALAMHEPQALPQEVR